MAAQREGAPAFGSLLEWLKWLGPLIGAAIVFVFTLYFNQSEMMKHNSDMDRRLSEMEKDKQLSDRALVDRLAKMDSDIRSLTHDLQFYQQTRSNGK